MAKSPLPIAVLALGAILAGSLLADSTPKPASPAPASRPAGIPLRFDERTGLVKIGRPAAPLMDELFIDDGNRISLAPVHIAVADPVQGRGYSGRYPVPMGAALSGPLKGKAWPIYGDTLLDVSPLGTTKLRTVYLWRILSNKAQSLAVINLNTTGSSALYISPAYVVFADDNRKVSAGGPFASFFFPAAPESVTVRLNGETIESGKAAKAGGTSIPLEKLTRKDLIEWEVADPNGYKGSLHPIVFGSDPLMVEYRILSPAEQAVGNPAPLPTTTAPATSDPATKPAGK